MNNINMSDVVEAWKQADPDDIHPLRRVDIDAYWDSGKAQATEAAEYIPDGGLVVDFGAGEGRLSIPLTQMGFEVVAVDTSETMLDRLAANAKDKLPRALQDELHLRRLLIEPGEQVSLGRRKADAIVSRAVLIHHSHADVANIVTGLAAVLKKGGHLIADWPLGPHAERHNWTGVTTWDETERGKVAKKAGLELVDEGTPAVTPTVWKKV
jgi:2-polyprenyl-3-methyl-5-hydroxy-6-metoxy-1,4-benzoquinol methylase